MVGKGDQDVAYSNIGGNTCVGHNAASVFDTEILFRDMKQGRVFLRNTVYAVTHTRVMGNFEITIDFSTKTSSITNSNIGSINKKSNFTGSNIDANISDKGELTGTNIGANNFSFVPLLNNF